MSHEHDQHKHCHHAKKKWYKNKTLIVLGVLILLVLISEPIPVLIPFKESLMMYVQTIWWAILLGLFIGGLIEHFVPKDVISYMLSGNERKSIIHAVIMGFFMSICSHGILALSIQLYKKGAATPAVIAFLLASPWANLPLTLLLIGFYGLIKAFYIIMVAIIIAFVTGFIFQSLEKRSLVERNPNSLNVEDGFTIKESFKKRFENYHLSGSQLKADVGEIWKGSLSLADMVLWWILIGVGLASLAGAYVPSNLFQQYMGPTFGGMMVTLAVATILEVCSEGTAPLSFELFRQTGALGNSLVFLMAGVATDYTEIGLLWHNVGRKTAIWLPIITVPQIVFWGYLANLIF